MSDIIYDDEEHDDQDHFDEEEESPIIAPRQVYLNDFSHRKAEHPAVSDPGDVVIEPTPAQRERVIHLVDQALDVTEAAMYSGDWGHKLRAAESVLDRAGVAKIHKTELKNTTPSVPAEALTQVIGGLAAMFGAKAPQDIKFAEKVESGEIEQALTELPEEPKEFTKAEKKGEKLGGLPQELLDRMQ